MKKYIAFVKTTNSKTRRRSKARVLRSVWFNKQKEPEKHYRELLMLFTPCRNEATDLLGNFASYEDRCMVISNVIKQRMKQYAVCNQFSFSFSYIYVIIHDTLHNDTLPTNSRASLGG